MFEVPLPRKSRPIARVPVDEMFNVPLLVQSWPAATDIEPPETLSVPELVDAAVTVSEPPETVTVAPELIVRVLIVMALPETTLGKLTAVDWVVTSSAL